MDKSLEFIKNTIPSNSSVVIAVSGGPDSMALLSLLIKLRESMNYKLIVSHINHNLREESEEEYEFVKKYSLDNKCTFEGIKFDNYDTNSIENEARNKRYEFFESILNKYDSKYLLTAHHGDDLVETILMKLTRGSSIEGYSGFKKISKRDNYFIVRPLIFYTKDEILEYLESNNIEYRVDKTNFSKKYTRNRYRLDILPLLKQENKNIHKKYLQFSEELEECNNFVSKYIDEKYNLIVKDYIDVDLLKQEDIFVIKRIIYKYLFSNIESVEINNDHINKVIDMIYNSKPNVELSLPGNYVLVKSYNKLYFVDNKNDNNYNVELIDRVDVFDGEIVLVNDSDLTNNFVCHLNSKDIKLPLYVRNRKDGDYVEILNLNGKKKIKDLFIDSKIDKDIRDKYPLVVDSNNNIVWVPGIKKSKYDRLKDENYDIIIEYHRRIR